MKKSLEYTSPFNRYHRLYFLALVLYNLEEGSYISRNALSNILNMSYTTISILAKLLDLRMYKEKLNKLNNNLNNKESEIIFYNIEKNELKQFIKAFEKYIIKNKNLARTIRTQIKKRVFNKKRNLILFETELNGKIIQVYHIKTKKLEKELKSETSSFINKHQLTLRYGTQTLF